MIVQTTRYGLSIKAGGWDGAGDPDTDLWLGGWGNKLTIQGCALTKSAKGLLGAKPLCWIKLSYTNGRIIIVQYQDNAPEDNPRVDIFLPYKDDPTIPDYATAEVLPEEPSI